LGRAEKKAQSKDYHTGCMNTRSKCTGTSSTKDACFSGKLPGNIDIREAATFQVNEHVYTGAVLLEDSELLTKLGTTNMVALEAKYHRKSIIDLCNRA